MHFSADPGLDDTLPKAVNEGSTLCGERRKRLLGLLRSLDEQAYNFVAPTPASHRRVVSRPDRRIAADLVDVLGWSLPVASGLLEPAMEVALLEAGVLTVRKDGLLQPQLRASRIHDQLFLHSAYPTIAADCVFLGPDSLRFASLIVARMGTSISIILDYGAGAGVGGIIAALNAPGAELVIADINPKALFLASVNAEHAGVRHRTVHVSSPRDIDGAMDLVVTHPPFMIDAERRTYRDGGDLFGAQLSLEWSLAGAALLAPGGRLIMHAGVSIVRGEDVLLAALANEIPSDRSLDYFEIDSDIFGDELDSQAYADVDRIAAVAVIIDRAAA